MIKIVLIDLLYKYCIGDSSFEAWRCKRNTTIEEDLIY